MENMENENMDKEYKENENVEIKANTDQSALNQTLFPRDNNNSGADWHYIWLDCRRRRRGEKPGHGGHRSGSFRYWAVTGDFYARNPDFHDQLG